MFENDRLYKDKLSKDMGAKAYWAYLVGWLVFLTGLLIYIIASLLHVGDWKIILLGIGFGGGLIAVVIQLVHAWRTREESTIARLRKLTRKAPAKRK